MTYKYSVPECGMEEVTDLEERALTLLKTENPAAVQLAEAYLAICHKALISGEVVNEMRQDREPGA